MYEELKKVIREVPDFPKKGILFYDITTLLKDAPSFKKVIDIFKERYENKGIDKIAAIESRGFIFGAALSYVLKKPFIPVRKPDKLPAETVKKEYSLEYGTDAIEIHKDAIEEGDKVLIIDDLLATGGTAKAVVDLIKEMGGEVRSIAFVIELTFLKGREKLKDIDIFSILKYDS